MGRYGRPGRSSLLAMMAVNAVLAVFLLKVVFALFHTGEVLPIRLAAWEWTRAAAHWDTLWTYLPGAAVGFACLWFWLIVVGRSQGVPWGAALFYGVSLAFLNVPLSGLIIGLLHGNPMLGLLLGLIVLLLVPALLCAMIVFGLTMGALNGAMASRWIERHRSG